MNFERLEDWRATRLTLRMSLRRLQSFPLHTQRPDAWKPSEVFHHVLLVEDKTAAVLERLLAKAGPQTGRSDAPWPVRPELIDFPLDTAFSVPPFPGTEPQILSDVALMNVEQATQSRLETLAERADRLELGALQFPHPLAGRLNFYEWLAFTAIHERLHLVQLRRDVGQDL